MKGPGRILAVFDDLDGAAAAQRLLQSQGIDAQASIDLTADPVAGEILGQSYLNQPGQGADDSGPASALDVLLSTPQASQAATSRQGAAVRSAACIVTIEGEPGSLSRAREMAMALGARRFI